MPPDAPSQRNRSECQAEFTYAISLKEIKIQDTGRWEKSVADDLGSCLAKDRELAPRIDRGLSDQF
ncbi:MAG: hypothetical protein WB586_24485 [Chthoniobacterales bacterium]